MDYLIALILISLSALFSGLTLGYFSLNPSTLRRRAKHGDKEALAIYPIRQKGNQLLTTLLLGNVIVNTSLSVFLGEIFSGLIAGVVATIAIFLFGEVIPQAVISRYALWFGSKMAPVMRLILWLLAPVAYPIGYLLDRALGEEMATLYSKKEIKEIISEIEDSEDSDIDADEERIVHGALEFSHTTVREVMTDKDQAVMYESNQRLDQEFLEEIASDGFSRYPVYCGNKDNIIGILYTKNLIVEEDEISITDTEDAFDREYLRVRPDDLLDKVLAMMLKRRKHMGIVMTKNGVFLGVITMEDIIEEIIQHEIKDEDDE